MGYTTEFEGKISVDPALTLDQFNLINDLKDSEDWRKGNGQPGGWCGWRPAKDGTGILWDDSEKFYYSVEWMQYIIDLLPEHQFSGEIAAQGEEMSDRWILQVKHRMAVKLDHPSLGQIVRCPHCEEQFELEAST